MSLEKLGPYRFKGVLGRGGMGTVYRGKHEDTGQFHAVKVLAPTYTDDDHFRGRFESEIKALLKLDHPNIVQLKSYGQENGMMFFSMELVEGNSLFQMQRKKHRFDWRQILAIAHDVCQGLRHAHDRGIIHRDLKPGNLLLADLTEPDAARHLPGVVKITDFGIAKSFGTSQNTGTNVLGTMDFMSPEQAKGEPVTFRSDLYSLGTVLFTLLSGKPPFAGNSVQEALRNLTQVPTPNVSTVVPDVPVEIDRLIQQMMSKRPEKRIPTALACLHKIDEVESLLKDYSEAKTAERNDATISDNDFEITCGKPSETTDLGTAKQRKINTRAGRRPAGRTVEYSDQDLAQIRRESTTDQPIDTVAGRLNRPVTKQADYFNTVTDHLRKQQTAVEPAPDEGHARGVVPLVLGLLAVLAVAGFGAYYALKPVSADVLFAQITAQKQNPERVMKEIHQFLELYPDEQRSLEVEQLQSVGDAVRFHNALTKRLGVTANIPGKNRLSPIEQKFLEIVELAETNSTNANLKMNAFVTLYSSSEELEDRDQKVLRAARSFRVKIRNDARDSVSKDLKQIRSAMERASRMDDPADAAEIYDSIVELYGNVMWGREAEGEEGRELVLEAGRLFEENIGQLRQDLKAEPVPARSASE